MDPNPIELDLVACLHDELDAERRAEVRRAVAADPALQAELESLRETLSAAALPAITPSPDFRERLRERIQCHERHQRHEPSGAADAPLTPSKRLRVSEPRKQPAVLRPRYLLVSLAVAAAVLLGLGWIRFAVPARPDVPEALTQAQITQGRMAQYHERMAAFDARRDIDWNGAPLLAADLGAPADADHLVLVGHTTTESADETCLVAYTPDEWDSYMESGSGLTGYGRRLWQQAKDSHTIAEIENGRITIPQSFVRDYLNAGVSVVDSVSVLRLAGRTEIWSSRRLDRYRNDAKIYLQVPTKVG